MDRGQVPEAAELPEVPNPLHQGLVVAPVLVPLLRPPLRGAAMKFGERKRRIGDVFSHRGHRIKSILTGQLEVGHCIVNSKPWKRTKGVDFFPPIAWVEKTDGAVRYRFEGSGQVLSSADDGKANFLIKVLP